MERVLTHWMGHGVLKPAASHTQLSQMIQRARTQVRDDHVRGGLLFDGERWATLFSGPTEDAWHSLMTCIEASTALSLHMYVAVMAPDLPIPEDSWRVGYVEAEAMDELIDTLQVAAAHPASQGTPALRRFVRLLDTSDSV